MKAIEKVNSGPQTSRSGYLTTASTFLALFLMMNKVKTTMRIGEQLKRFNSERGGLIGQHCFR